VLIIGDSHIRLCATNIKSEIKDSYDVQGLVKPGAGSGTLVNSATSDICNLTKNDVVIFCGGANDITKNNSKTALRHIRNFVNSNNHTNIVLLSVPHRFDLMQSSCVNNEIKSFNRKLRKSIRAFNHACFGNN
jgi:predicted phosphodiesterase